MLGVSSLHRCFSPLLPQPSAVGPSSLHTSSLPFSPISSFTSPRIRVCSELYASSSGQRSRRGGPADECRSSADDEEGEEKGADLDLPMGEMRRWFADKPKGFGEGKVYDTFVEERLLEEIEQSRSAQLANLAKLNGPTSSAPNSGKAKNYAKDVAIVDVPSGIPVHVSNLPKKKNIHRDLKLAFEGFPGIVTISPVVSGNNKTRDPICKGFAFVYLNSAKAAHRFVDVYSKKDIRFGKVEKRIICKTKDRHTSDSTEYIDGELGDGNESSDGFDIEDFDRSLPSEQDESVSGFAIRHENVLFECDLGEDDRETIDILGSGKEETLEIKNGSTALSIRKFPKLQGVTRKQTPQQARKKSSKFSVPRSAVRLKVNEKAVLMGVLSKYNAKTD